MSKLQTGAVDIIWDLPECLLTSICMTWLHLKQVGFLDSAYCTKEKRPTYLNLLRSDKFILGHQLSNKNLQLLRWVCQRSVKISKFKIFFQLDMDILLVSGKTLRTLVLDSITENSWGVLGQYCKHITYLKVTECILSVGLQTFIAQNTNLQRAHFELCEKDEPTQQNFAPCASLRILEVVCGFLVYSSGESFILSVLQLCPSALETLYIRAAVSFRASMYSVSMTDVSLLRLFQSCKQLTHLDLPGNNHISDDTLYAIADNLRVTVLDLVNNRRITDAGLLRLATTQSATLKCLYLDGTNVSTDGIEPLVRNCTKLTSLSLPIIGEQALLITHILPHCGKLHTLAIDEKDGLFLDPLLFAIAKCCPRICNLTLHVGEGSEAGLRAVIRNCTQLKKLVFSSEGCTNNAVALVAWSVLRPGLTFFDEASEILPETMLCYMKSMSPFDTF